MGDSSQPRFLKKSLQEVGFLNSSSPKLALNTGSLSENFGSDYSFLEDYNIKVDGCDIQSGKNVDHVFDLTKEVPGELHNRYDLIITASTLEHVTEPWNAARNLELIVKPEGLIYISVPWIWRYHAYPNDYWRFNHHTLDIIFKGSKMLSEAWSTSPDCELHDYLDSFDNINHTILNQPPKETLLSKLRRLIKKTSSFQNYQRKYLPYLMIHQLRRVNKVHNTKISG